MNKIILNVATEDGELLEQIEVEVTDDRQYPIGGHAACWAVIHEIQHAAKIVQARAAKEHA